MKAIGQNPRTMLSLLGLLVLVAALALNTGCGGDKPEPETDAEAAMEAVQIRFELGAEIGTLDVVDGLVEAIGAIHGHAPALGAQVGVVIGPVVKVIDAIVR